MRLIVWAFRILIVMFIVRLVLRMIFPARARRVPKPPSGRVAERAGGALVRDPQCGMYIPQAGAVTVSARTGTQFFCSTACRDQWLASPDHAVSRA